MKDWSHALPRGGTDSLACDVSKSRVGPTRYREVVLTLARDVSESRVGPDATALRY
jgi:hypothetical protein